VVRTTGSGDACPDWPRCHGEILPPLESGVLIEFSHRLVASVVGFLVLATALVAWRNRRRAPLVAWAAVGAVGLVIAQIILGGVTVLSELHANVVTAHLALASTLLALLLSITLVSFRPELLRFERAGTSFRNLALVATLAVFALMLTGSYVSGSGAGLAFRDWPLFDGALMPDGGRLAMIHATHRFAAGAVGLLLVYVAWRAGQWRTASPLLWALSAAAVALYITQALVGAANIWTLLQPAAAAAHLALAAALWSMLVALSWLANGAPEATRRPATTADEPGRLAQVAPARGPSS
jgi:heme A synthase